MVDGAGVTGVTQLDDVSAATWLDDGDVRAATTRGVTGGLAPIDARGVDPGPGVLVGSATDEPGADHPAWFRTAASERETWATCAIAAGADGRYHTIGRAIGLDFPFLDTDVYKWLEGVAWELGHGRRSGACRGGGRGHRPDPGRTAAGRLHQFVCPGCCARTRIPGPGLGPRALLRGAPDPGGRGLAARPWRRTPPRGRRSSRRFGRSRARS